LLGYPIRLFTDTYYGNVDDNAFGYKVIPQSVPYNGPHTRPNTVFVLASGATPTNAYGIYPAPAFTWPALISIIPLVLFEIPTYNRDYTFNVELSTALTYSAFWVFIPGYATVLANVELILVAPTSLTVSNFPVAWITQLLGSAYPFAAYIYPTFWLFKVNTILLLLAIIESCCEESDIAFGMWELIALFLLVTSVAIDESVYASQTTWIAASLLSTYIFVVAS